MLSVRPVPPLLLAVTAFAAAPAPASADVTGPQIVAFVNAQRVAHGIPGGIVEDPALSDGCAKHDRYGAANDTLTHEESPAAPGYTPEGDAAARQAVLYAGRTWTATDNPFENAPIHLHQLLSPFLDRMGAFETQGYGCATTLASLDRVPEATDTLFVYPGDGTTGWRASEVANDGARTPGQTVGIPAGTRTGPTLYVLASGPGLQWTSDTKVLAASLTGPSGPVDLVTFDRSSPQVGSYLPAGAQLLPPAPLMEGTTYTASVRLRVRRGNEGPREIARTWSFTTAGGVAVGGTVLPAATTMPAQSTKATASRACTAKLRFAGERREGKRRTLRLRTTACKATTLRVTLRRRGRVTLTRTFRLKASASRTVSVALPRRVPGGRYAVRATMVGAALTFSTRVPAPPR